MGRALALGVLAACAQAGASDHEHGPTYGGDASADGDASPGGDDASREAGAPADGPSSDSPADDAAQGSGDAGPDGPPDGDSGGDSGGSGGARDAAEAGVVAPTCDGTIAPGEYGDSSHSLATSTGQTWYVTWDDTSLYVGITGATVAEANVIYLAADPADGGTGLGAGYAYDHTDVTRLPFAAGAVVYAKASYTEARTPSGGAWSAPDTSSVRICPTGTSVTGTTREEVIPWALLGGRPASFGWLGYLAATSNPGTNPTGFVYGQVPPDNPAGADAGAETFGRYYVVPDATPGVDGPFSGEL